MTPGRWILACITGCLIVAAALLPPPVSDDELFYISWRPEWNGHERTLERRTQIARAHAGLLMRAYSNAHDEAAAQRLFGPARASGPTPAANDSVLIWFDSDVPDAARHRIKQIVAAEDSARGSWRGKGAVGILVFTDTATAMDGVGLPWGRSGLSVATKVLPVSKATGGRCVTVVRLGHAVLARGDTIAADRQLLDGCAFYDAFGEPGAADRGVAGRGARGVRAHSLLRTYRDGSAEPVGLARLQLLLW